MSPEILRWEVERRWKYSSLSQKPSLDHEIHFGWEKVHHKGVKKSTRVNKKPETKSVRLNRTLIQAARL